MAPFALVRMRVVELGTQTWQQPQEIMANGCPVRSCRIYLYQLWRIVESYPCTEQPSSPFLCAYTRMQEVPTLALSFTGVCQALTAQ